ncbi:MAG: trehalose-6-phosphate synthase [Beijerinckiaceae bacterium]|nr:trehalose-6-phosphate synthase [Beijerinckiaceae bacterium]
MARLVVVSNRVSIPDPSGKAAAGGLAVALCEALEEHKGLWFGWSGKTSANPSLQPSLLQRGAVQYALMDLTATDRQEYYSGFANRALWPTMHYRVGLSEFSRADYAGYLRVNRRFAQALASLVSPSDHIWVHDYHLLPLAAELRALGLQNRIGYFHHIPWPAPEVFNMLPGSADLLRAMMDYDLIGAQTERDGDNLKRNLIQELGAQKQGEAGVTLGNRTTVIKGFPIGIDVDAFQKAAVRGHSQKIVRQTIASLGSRSLVMSVDRLDYSKGIPERMEAFERFLLANPDQRNRVTFLQIAPVSRSEVPEYAMLSRQVNETLGRVNGGYGEPGWVPIHYVSNSYARAVLAGLFRVARVGLITPLRDGMNLVAKEFVAAQDPEDPGVLVLSKFAGAALQLPEALIVNPNDKFEVADAIREALNMGLQERIDRWRPMLETIQRKDVRWWSSAYLQDLTGAREPTKVFSDA